MSPVGQFILIFLLGCCFFLSACLIVSLFFLWKLGTTVLKMEDACETALDRLDSAYRRIGKVLENPVGSDDPYVLESIDSIRYARNAILEAATDLAGSVIEEEDEETE